MSVKDIFITLDVNRNGVLSKDELVSGFMMGSNSLNKETTDKLWLLADENFDDRIDLDEFEKVWKLAQMLDEVRAEVAGLEKELSVNISFAQSAGQVTPAQSSPDTDSLRSSMNGGGRPIDGNADRTVSKNTRKKIRKQLLAAGFGFHPELSAMGVRDIFAQLDKNGNGVLSKAELRKGFMVNTGSLDDETLNQLWRVADENFDDRIDLDEFEKLWKMTLRLTEMKAECDALR